jgi:hypothetical protein
MPCKILRYSHLAPGTRLILRYSSLVGCVVKSLSRERVFSSQEEQPLEFLHVLKSKFLLCFAECLKYPQSLLSLQLLESDYMGCSTSCGIPLLLNINRESNAVTEGSDFVHWSILAVPPLNPPFHYDMRFQPDSRFVASYYRNEHASLSGCS